MFTSINYMPPQMPRTLAEDIGAPELRHPMNYVRKADKMGLAKRLSGLMRSHLTQRQESHACASGMNGQCTSKAIA